MVSSPITTEKEIVSAFARIEDELIASMIRNLKRHQAEEAIEGFKWAQWQAEQLRLIDAYARANGLRYGRRFDVLNKKIETAIADSYTNAGDAMERRILRAVSQGWKPVKEPGFFGLNSQRLDALIQATHSDLMTAEYSVLRQATDQYRKIVFDAQLYAQSGAGTYAQAIDMATNDFLHKGIQSIPYRSKTTGQVVAVHRIETYSQMVIRTSTKRAAFVGEGDKRREWGCHLVYIPDRDDACPDCMEWVGQVLVDNVYSGGTEKEAQENDYPLLSEAMDAGLFHPNCKDTMSTYFPGVSDDPTAPSAERFREATEREAREVERDKALANERKYERVAEYSLEEAKQERYHALASKWEDYAEDMA